jgi:DNA modification methylase
MKRKPTKEKHSQPPLVRPGAGYLRKLKVEWSSIRSLKPSARNPRTHSARQLGQIADSIRQFGFTNPVLIDAGGGVIAGHGRIEAANLLGMEEVPTIRLDQMSEAQKRAYVLADNKLAENAGWDRELLALELQYLEELELDFDVTITGFETAEIDLLIGELEVSQKADRADQVPAVDASSAAVTRLGDLWLLGKHRLLCSDATKAESFERLLDGAQAQMVFTDPPYNVPIDGNVCGSGAIRHREFMMATGEMSEAQYTSFLTPSFRHLADHSVDGSIHYICIDWRHLFEILSASRAVYSELKNVCVWNKTNAGMGSLYRSKHELVFVFKHGTGKHINNVELGRFGRNRTNVWDYVGVNSLHPGRLDDLAMHPTVKPVALVADAIRDCSHRDAIVLDSFAGSGTTLVAAHKTGRRGYLIELDPVYVDVTVKRFEQLTGETAIHADTGRSFDEMREQRVHLRGDNHAAVRGTENE